jgi:DNA polymerase III subunit epsilon
MSLVQLWHRLWERKEPAPGLGETVFTVLDTELTGLDDRKDDIVSIGAVRMRGARIQVGGTFHCLVKPRALLEGRSIVIHGILPSQVESEPPIEEALPPFLAYAGDTVLVGHCLALDMAFLNREARRLRGSPLVNPLVDTMSLYAWLRNRHPHEPAFRIPLADLSLFSLAGHFDIPVEKAHTALGDAYVTALLFQRFLPLLAEAGVTDLESLLWVGDPLRQAENLNRAQVQF